MNGFLITAVLLVVPGWFSEPYRDKTGTTRFENGPATLDVRKNMAIAERSCEDASNASRYALRSGEHERTASRTRPARIHAERGFSHSTQSVER